jgi:hypothetical protein
MSSWLDLSDNANCFKQTYVQGFVDISGGSIITRGPNDGIVIGGDSSLNGTVYLGDSIFVRSDGLVALGDASNGATAIYVDVSGGPNVAGSTSYDVSGNAGNGATVAINIPSNAAWSPLGATMVGEFGNDNAGFTTSFSADGTVVAVSLRGNSTDVSSNYANNTGSVRVYEYKAIATQSEWDDISNNVGPNYGGVVKSSPTDTWINSTTKYWVQLGADVDNPAQLNHGISYKLDVSLIKDASENIYIATTTSGIDYTYPNHVRVYQYRSVSSSEWTDTYNTTSLTYTVKPVLISGGDVSWTENKKYWVQVGNELEFSNTETRSVAIAKDNSNNLFLAYGSNSQSVHSYILTGTSWVQIANDVAGSSIKQISLSSDGRRMASFSANYCRVHTLIYNEVGGSWSWTILRQSPGIDSSSPIAISGDGRYIAYRPDSSSDRIVIEQLSDVAWAEPLNTWSINFEIWYDIPLSIAFSYNGSIISIGFAYNPNDGIHDSGGMVRSYKYAVFTEDMSYNEIYHYQSSIQNTTDQPKPLINTESTSTAPVVGDYYWMQTGSDINGTSDQTYNGSSVNLSADGLRLVAGAYGSGRTTYSTAFNTTNISDVSSTVLRLNPNNSFQSYFIAYLNRSITQIKLYKPYAGDNVISISEIQVWVNDENIAAASASQYQKDLSASSIGAGSSLSYLNDANLGTSFETDDIANQWITMTFNSEIPLTSIQSIVIYTDSTTALYQTDISLYNNEDLILTYMVSSSGNPVVMYAYSDLVISTGSVQVYEITNTKTYSDVSGGYYDVSVFSGYNNDGLTTAALYVKGDTDLSGGLIVGGDVAFNAGNLFVAGDLSVNGTLSVGAFAPNSIGADAIDSTVDIELANKLYVSTADLDFNATGLRVAADLSYNNLADPSHNFTDASVNLAANLTVPANIAIVDGSNGTVYGSYLTLTNKAATAYYNVGKSASGLFNIVDQASAGVYLASGGTSFTGTSDARLKTNVAPLESATAKIMALNPCTYQWKSDVDSTNNDNAITKTKTHIGFIAQEVEKIMPELVHPIDHPAGPDYKGVNTTDLIPYLVRTIQEQTQRIATLQAKLAQIKKA